MQRAAPATLGRLPVELRGLREGVGVQRAHGVGLDVDGRDPVEELLGGVLGGLGHGRDHA